MVRFFETFEPTAHPMAILSSAVSVLSTFYNDSTDPRDPEQVELSTIRLLAKLPVLTSYTYKSLLGESFVDPDNSLSLVENFLRMTFGHQGEEWSSNPVLTQALDTLLLLHADHEQNCSTSTVRLVGSSQANLFASISSGINALSGPLHGGANEAVLDMLTFIHESGDSVQKYVERVKNKEDGIRLMGFGHRVYKSFDPRAKIVKSHADKVLTELGVSDPLLDIAKELEAAALADSYFVERKLYPNVDFYTGVIYKAMGFPSRMFTPLFAVGRLPGWIAHWREQNSDPHTRIGRPQQIYTGLTERSI
jgi:citrate synthase